MENALVQPSEVEKVEIDSGPLPPSVNKKPKLKVFSFKDLVHEIETLNKEDALARLAKLEDKQAMTYFEIGGVLSVIHHNKFYDPYDSFDEWVENKAGMKRAKARMLIQIYKAITNSGITGAEVLHIGWTKLRVIAPILTTDNVLEWLERAENQNNTREELEKLVKAHRKLVKEQLAAPGGSVGGVSTAKHKKTFKLHDDQNEMVEAALDKAKKVSGTPHDSVAFEHISLDNTCGETLSQRLKTVGPANGAKAVAEAYEGEALAAFIKAFGVEDLLLAIANAFNWYIKVSEADDVVSAAE